MAVVRRPVRTGRRSADQTATARVRQHQAVDQTPRSFGTATPVRRAAGSLYHAIDLFLRDGRIARPDMIFLTPEQEERQNQAERDRGLADDVYRSAFVPPLLVVESLSPKHE